MTGGGDSSGSAAGPWTADRTEPERSDVPHHPFTLQLSLPTKLDPAYVRTVKTGSRGDPTEIVERVRRSVRAADFVVVSDSKLLMGHGSGERSYPKGTDILLVERNVRVDVTENARGRQRSRGYFAALGLSCVAFAVLDLTIPQYWGWVFPVTGAIAAFLLLGLFSATTSVFVSEILVAAIVSDPAHGGRVELSGALAQSKNHASKGATWRTVTRSVTTSEVSRAVDEVAAKLSAGDRLTD